MSNYTPPFDPLADLGAIGTYRKCTCVPVTAAGVMVLDPHCPAHGKPAFTFTVAAFPSSPTEGEKERTTTKI